MEVVRFPVFDGYHPGVAGQDAGNNLALQLVMESLKIMPVNKAYPLEVLMKSVRRWAHVTRYPVTFEYIMIDLTGGPRALGSLIAIDPASGRAQPPLPLPPSTQPYLLAASPDGLFVATGRRLLRINPSDGSVLASAAVGGRPRAVVEADPDREHFNFFNWHLGGYDRKKSDAGSPQWHLLSTMCASYNWAKPRSGRGSPRCSPRSVYLNRA